MEKKDTNRSKALAAAAGAAALGSAAPKNILGYNTVYHGTSHEAAAAIRKQGLRRKFAGSAVAGNDVKAGQTTMDKVKGRVFTTSNKEYAKHYHPGLFLKNGDTVKMKTPYRGPSRRPEDDVIKGLAAKAKDPSERVAAKQTQKMIHIFKHDIKPRFVEGAKEYKGAKQFATKGNLRRYLSQSGGKARFAKGIAQAAGATALGAYSVNKVKELTKKAALSLREIQENRSHRNRRLDAAPALVGGALVAHGVGVGLSGTTGRQKVSVIDGKIVKKPERVYHTLQGKGLRQGAKTVGNLAKKTLPVALVGAAATGLAAKGYKYLAEEKARRQEQTRRKELRGKSA